MLHPIAAAFAVLRHWKLATACLALLFAAWTHGARLGAERALERCRGEAALAELRLERANQAAQALRLDSRRRSAEQQRLLRDARRDNRDEADRIGALKRSAAAPRQGADCPLSDPLRQVEKRL